MRILHTADWHLSDRLKHIDRTKDLERAVEQIADYCEQHAVDVLVIAGDLLSELARPEGLQCSLAHLSQTFRQFLMRSGTIVAIAGNHDRDIYCETLRRAFQLAAPNSAQHGDILSPGRFYLMTKPAYFQLCDSQQMPVQFVCMPYPSFARLGPSQTVHEYTSFDERREALHREFVRRLGSIRSQLNPRQPSILVAHINTIATAQTALFHHPLADDFVIDDPIMTTGWTYVALGHLHGPGKVRCLQYARYSGSIERLSIAEKDQNKSVALVEIENPGRPVKIRLLPLASTTFYDLQINEPRLELPRIHERYDDASTALTRCHVRYDPEKDNLHAILSELARLFPRCYERTWSEKKPRQGWHPPSPRDSSGTAAISRSEVSQSDDPSTLERVTAALDANHSFRQVVLSYLDAQLAQDSDQAEIVALVQQLLEAAE